MNDEERARKIAEQEALIRQQQDARKKDDRPQPTLKPKHAQGRHEPFVEKTPEEITKEATATVDQRDAAARAKEDEAKRNMAPLERARDADISNEFTERGRKKRPSFQEREAKLRAEHQSDAKQKEQKQERDSRFESRYLHDEERER